MWCITISKEMVIKFFYSTCVFLFMSVLTTAFLMLREKNGFTNPNYLLTKLEDRCRDLNNEFDVQENAQENDMGSERYTGCPCAMRDKNLTMIYMITPTYRRAEQIPELIRTGQTLLNVPNLKWIIVEDAVDPTPAVEEYLDRSGLDFVLLTALMPEKFSRYNPKPRGVANRNKGLNWIRENAKNGVIYFGDDDNTYDIRLFEEIRSTKRIAVFPVGHMKRSGVSSPIVREGKVVGYLDGFISKRKFPFDMAGFSISVELILEKENVSMPYHVGYEEDGFLKNLGVREKEFEIKADNCTKIMVWHTQSVSMGPIASSNFDTEFSDTNLPELQLQTWTKKTR